LQFFIIPLSFGTYYKTAVIFFGNSMPYFAKICGIMLAMLANFLIGFIIRKITLKFIPKAKQEISKYAFLFTLFLFIPVISGVISLYFGLLKVNLFKFFIIALVVNCLYYGLAIIFPVLNLSF
jgi:membrane protein YqaA with SNARE-associated domain